MSGFNSWAVYQKYYGRNKEEVFKLYKDLQYKTMDGAVYVVYSGFISDLGSIPWMLWPIIPRDSFPSAFILHDWLCNADWISRSDANKILYEALKLSHCPQWKASAIYWACQAYAKVMRIK